MHPQVETNTPSDFPRDHALGSVSGVQPKLLVRKVGDAYVHGATAEELYARYDMCFDLVNQLTDYCTRKLKERTDWTAAELLERVRTTVRTRSEWGLSDGEVEWVMGQLSLRLS